MVGSGAGRGRNTEQDKSNLVVAKPVPISICLKLTAGKGLPPSFFSRDWNFYSNLGIDRMGATNSRATATHLHATATHLRATATHLHVTATQPRDTTPRDHGHNKCDRKKNLSAKKIIAGDYCKFQIRRLLLIQQRLDRSPLLQERSQPISSKFPLQFSSLKLKSSAPNILCDKPHPL